MPLIKNIDQLTSLRFFAATAIVFHHSKSLFAVTKGLESPIPLDFAVSFFFVLSGFILTYNYRSLATRAQVLNYYGARVARVWPVHLFSMALVIIFLPRGVWTSTQEPGAVAGITLANLFLLHAWVPLTGYFFSYNAVSWSISTELFFYLAFPWLIRDWHCTAGVKTSVVVVLAVGLLAFAVLLPLPPIDFQKPLTISSTGIAYISPLVRISEFLLGIWTAKIFIRFEHVEAGNSRFWTLLEAMAFFLIYLCGVACMQVIRGNAQPNAWEIYVGASGGAPAFALGVGVLAYGRGWFSRALAVKPLVMLGHASFALYMTHQIVFSYLVVNPASVLARLPDHLLFSIYWIGCVALSVAIHRYVEEPSRNFIRTLLKSRDIPSARTS